MAVMALERLAVPPVLLMLMTTVALVNNAIIYALAAQQLAIQPARAVLPGPSSSMGHRPAFHLVGLIGINLEGSVMVNLY